MSNNTYIQLNIKGEKQGWTPLLQEDYRMLEVAEELLEWIAAHYEVSTQDIRSKSRSGQVVRARNEFVYIGMEQYKLTIDLLGAVLGCSDREIICMKVRRINSLGEQFEPYGYIHKKYEGQQL